MDLLKEPEVLLRQAQEMAADQNRVEPDGRGGDSGGTSPPPPSLGLSLGGGHSVWDPIEDRRFVNQGPRNPENQVARPQAGFRTLDAEPEPSVLLERYRSSVQDAGEVLFKISS